jgi:hypothetical protein
MFVISGVLIEPFKSEIATISMFVKYEKQVTVKLLVYVCL